jgi:hypothetical protein
MDKEGRKNSIVSKGNFTIETFIVLKAIVGFAVY